MLGMLVFAMGEYLKYFREYTSGITRKDFGELETLDLEFVKKTPNSLLGAPDSHIVNPLDLKELMCSHALKYPCKYFGRKLKLLFAICWSVIFFFSKVRVWEII